MPLGDWQFWVVTIAAIVAVGFVVRAVRPRRKPKAKRTELTVEGRRR